MEQNDIIDQAVEINNSYLPVVHSAPAAPTAKPFIVANTVESTLQDIRSRHIIPVFTKDNEPLISHADFVEVTSEVVGSMYFGETIEAPQIRLSHPVKGRIPEAKDKPAALLTDAEKTIYYERMMFIIELPSISDTIDGNVLSLTVGGVKAYSQDNLYSRVCDQHFKVFIGFKNQVCSNLCVWTDGYLDELKVRNVGQLHGAIKTLIQKYNQGFQLYHMKQLVNHSITEHQFAQIVGKCRMYQHLPSEWKKDIHPMHMGDQQIGAVVKDFYKDESFCKDENGEINLWRLYNLFTNAAKSSYIDQFINRNVNAFDFVEMLRIAIQDKAPNWYLN